MSSVSCNADLQSLVPLPDCSVNHSLIKTVSLFLDALTPLFHVLDLVLLNAVVQNSPHRIVDGIKKWGPIYEISYYIS